MASRTRQAKKAKGDGEKVEDSFNSDNFEFVDTSTTACDGPAAMSDTNLTQASVSGGPVSIDYINNYFVKMTEKFEKMIAHAVDSLVENVKRVERDLGAAIELESKRVTALEQRNMALEEKVAILESQVTSLQRDSAEQKAGINKAERFSRRNNLRLVGKPESANEDCIDIVQDIIREKFGINSRIERAHRDGRPSNDPEHPRHILFKFLSFRDKVTVMKSARSKLSKESYFLVDDLTKDDLIEKRRYSQEVKRLYQTGTKLKFTAGKWRHLNGTPYDFTGRQGQKQADARM